MRVLRWSVVKCSSPPNKPFYIMFECNVVYRTMISTSLPALRASSWPTNTASLGFSHRGAGEADEADIAEEEEEEKEEEEAEGRDPRRTGTRAAIP